jgi:polar amino acid transport system substrate-binding protein
MHKVFVCVVMTLGMLVTFALHGSGQQRAVPPAGGNTCEGVSPGTPDAAMGVERDVLATVRPPTLTSQLGRMPEGSHVHTILKRGFILVGVYDDLKPFGFADPQQKGNKLVGFDIDLARRITRAIFDAKAPPDELDKYIRFIKVTSNDRWAKVRDGTVDMVVATATITRERKELVDFSEVYFCAGQRVLVRKDSTAKELKELNGQYVCVVQESTGAEAVCKIPGVQVKRRILEQYTDCLVAFRKGEVEAIVSDDGILAGLAAQDPYAKIVGPLLTREPYGVVVSKAHPQFTAFINGVLAEMKKSSAENEKDPLSWKALYKKWLVPSLGPTIPEPPQGVCK